MPKKSKNEEPKPESEEEEEDEEDDEDSAESGPEEEPAKKPEAKEFNPPPRKEEEEEEETKAEAPPAKPKPFVAEFKPHKDYPPIDSLGEVEYCPTCGLPPDFCQYGPSWERCKPWCMEKYPQYYPELSGVSIEDAKKSAEAAADKGKVKELPGGKKKREASPHVTIRKLSRGGRKCVTSVTGLEGFGVNLDAATKVFKKKFSCGVSVVKGDPGQPDSVDIQGDFDHDLIELCQKEYKDIPREKFTIVDGGTKKKGKGK